MNHSAEYKPKSHSAVIRTLILHGITLWFFSSPDRLSSHSMSSVFKLLHLTKSPEKKCITTFLCMNLTLLQ